MKTIKNQAVDKTHQTLGEIKVGDGFKESKIDEFDKLDAVIRLMLYMYESPPLNVSKLMKFRGGQRSFYSAKKFLETNELLEISVDEKNNPLYSLNEKGKKIAEHLRNIEKILEN